MTYLIRLPAGIRLAQPTLLLGALTLMRTCELSDTRAKDISIDVPQRYVRIMITHSKTDVHARGCRQGWFCMRGCALSCLQGEASRWLLCPFHLCLHIAVVAHNFPLALPGLRPVGGTEHFVTKTNGMPVQPADVAKALTLLESRADISAEAEEASDASWGGHSLRRTGVIRWHALGIPEETLRRLARWRTAIIESYLGQAPLSSLGPWTLGTSQAAQQTQAVTIERTMAEIRRQVANYFQELRRSHKTEQPSQPSICPQGSQASANTQPEEKAKDQPPPPVPVPQYAISTMPGKPKKHHLILQWCGPPSSWATRCGWAFGRSNHYEVHAVLETAWVACTKGCYKKEAANT